MPTGRVFVFARIIISDDNTHICVVSLNTGFFTIKEIDNDGFERVPRAILISRTMVRFHC